MNEPLTPKQAEYIAAMIEAMAMGHWKRGISGNLALEDWQRLGQMLRDSHGLMAVSDQAAYFEAAQQVIGGMAKDLK